tara:strand:+ start:166 stop:402 length:237 start_codon:yes stop_codon:yes gene_type:complete
MTDTEILEEVYRRLKGNDPHGWKTNPLKDGVTSFIEREWQREDEHGESKWRQANHPRADSDPHRELNIGEDGTVKSLK